jgi:PPP family 3-phenylpropionic acid transporter
MQSPAWVLVINMMQAVTYVPFWLGSVSHSMELAPQELKSTSQGLLLMVMNLSNVLGALACGWLFDHVGPRNLFAILAGVCLSAFVLFIQGNKYLNRRLIVA